MTAASETHFGVRELDNEQGCLHLQTPDFDYDSFADVAQALVTVLGASVVEKEANADLHIWLIDFEGCRMMLKGEHYSAAMWLELLSRDDSDTLAFLASWLNKLTQ
ncbi:DUF3630 family protein [Photobacterium halotolerans]|uniref:Aminopeptidase n=2 Tax=Photobacterium TaxID=657 RepID=A0A0F5V925_9GAMM|nr:MULTISPECIES: DUF3630 family protein [Photobacterium]KKC98670.1 hypothetical protein KY46_17175 [Photobacterium halotolerans]UIP29565.1 DUF3630 family protein [Photobacterium sp. TLY01]